MRVRPAPPPPHHALAYHRVSRLLALARAASSAFFASFISEAFVFT